MTGIKEYRDRLGTWRRYYRRKGAPSVPISMDLKGAALAAEVARLDALYKPLAPVAGTLRTLVAEYKTTSEHWRLKLRDRTRKDYERVFTLLLPVMDHSLAHFTTPVLVGMRDKARDAHGFKFANQVIVTLKMVFAFGVQYGHMKVNPANDVEQAVRPADLPDANRPWEPAEAIASLAAMPIHLKAPTALAAYLGIREGDIVRMVKTARKGNLLDFTTSKTRRPLELPICDDLDAILSEYEVWRAALFAKQERTDDATTLFVNSRGKPWTDDGFKTSWGKERNRLLEAKKIGPALTFHGARHGVSTILADEGFGADQVKHLLGHGTESMTEHYQRRAKRRPLLKSMAERVQAVYRNTANPNVVGIETGTEVTNSSAGSV